MNSSQSKAATGTTAELELRMEDEIDDRRVDGLRLDTIKYKIKSNINIS